MTNPRDIPGGNYFCICLACTRNFQGHKRGRMCALCAAEQAKSAPAEPVVKESFTADQKGEVEIPDIVATVDGLYLLQIKPLKRGDHLMTVAQHNRIVAALTAPPSPDAEFVGLLRDARKYLVPGAVLARIDAKLASLRK